MPPKVVCGNPLFLGWLEEAANDAAAKGSKMEFAYKKAARSLKQCPLTFEHPEQTRQLVGVGDTIINYLTRKLKHHCDEKGNAMPDKPVPTKKLKAPPAPKKRKVSASQLPSDDEGDTGGNARAGPSTSGSLGALAPSRRVPNAGCESESDDDDPEFLRRMEEMENGAPAAKKTKKAAAKKPAKRYFPKQASGAYAILLALHSVSSTEDMHVELNKKEIIDIAEAKGWSDASFNKPKDGGFATAWNGMSTLVSKGYCIQKGSRMAKFHLSEEGFEVAQLQYETLPVDPFEQDRRDRLSQLASTLGSRPGATFSRTNSAPAVASPAKASTSRAERLAEILALATTRSQSQSSVPTARAFSTSASLAVPKSAAAADLSRPASLGGASRSPSFDDGPHQRPRSSAQIAFAGDVAGPSVSVDVNFRPIIWHAGSYEIVLLMDHREKSGKRGEQGAIPLREQGVPAETSNDMVLGDIMWVARRTDGGQEGGIEAVVLDYIIERKRLDDLMSSIRDGRFREQKTRLKSSGIGQVVYLLEKFHVGEQQDAWWSAVTTSKSSMQIIDGFFVHETDSWEGSITYLKSMHEAIVDIHQNQSLYIIPDDRIHRPTYSELQRQLRLQHPTKPHLTSVQAFKRLNSKNASMTHRDVWCKMLLTIAGLSPEKVAAIVEVYPTPLSLSRAFKEAEHVERAAKESAIGLTGKAPKIPLAENLLANDNPGSNRQKIGPALSRKIYELIRAKKYPSMAEAD